MQEQKRETIIYVAMISSMIITALLALVFLAEGAQAQTVPGIHEDQYIMCNFEGKCYTINQDDWLSRAQVEDFNIMFDNDMDTYDIEDIGAHD